MNKFALRPLVAALVLSAPVMSAFATDGYFSHGYGMKAKGMGGAAVASTDNAFAGANNPATSAWAGNRMEAGVDLFMPKRSFSRVGTADTSQGGGSSHTDVTFSSESESNLFLIPEFGYNKTIDGRSSWGVTVYGNGGMNTDYPAPAAYGSGFGTSGRLGVDLTQLIVAPTYAIKIDERSSLGVSPLLVYQQFKAEGLHNFAGLSASPANLTNNGKDSSTGVGVRLGYFSQVNSEFSWGVSYSPKIKMSNLSKYSGLFAQGGNFDIPENVSVGFAFQATPAVKVLTDFQQIKYGDVAAISNPGSNIYQCPSVSATCLGGANGAGFGWNNVNVVKLGVQWQASPVLTLRAGYNQTTNPVGSSEVTFNILAPGVVNKHYTLGGTYAISPAQELTVAYMYAPQNEVSGNYLLRGQNETAVDKIRMSQQSLGIQFGWKF